MVVNEPEDVPRDYCVYLLINTTNKYTYLGITNNSKRRIRQHNCIIKGGAKYTSSKKGDGEWIYHLKIKNMTKRESLSMERIAKLTRRRGKGKTPLAKRISVLIPLMEKFPFCEIEYFH